MTVGARFDKLTAELAAKGAADPKGLAAWIGKKKYGKAGFQKLAEAGRKIHGNRSVGDDVLYALDVDRQHFRTGLADLEIRSGGDGRTIVGIAVPFNKPQRIDDRLVEAFSPNAFDHQLRSLYRTGYWREHSIHGGEEMGHLKDYRVDAAGLYTESYVQRGEQGDRFLDEIRSGKYPHQSVGFETGPGGSEVRDGVTYRNKARLFELAAVPVGAYGSSAAIAGVRSGVCPTCGHQASVEPQGHATTAARAALARLPRLG